MTLVVTQLDLRLKFKILNFALLSKPLFTKVRLGGRRRTSLLWILYLLEALLAECSSHYLNVQTEKAI